MTPSPIVPIMALADGVFGLRLTSDAQPHLGLDSIARLEAAVTELNRLDPDQLRAVVLLGGERFFANGAHRSLLTAEDAATTIPHLIRALPGLLFNLAVPTIAAIAGHAQGGGLMFGLWCDLAFLGQQSLYSANFVALSFTPGMGSSLRLAELFGTATATEMLLTGDRFTGAELAERSPLFAPNIVPSSEVTARAIALATTIAERDPVAVRLTTALQRRRLRSTFERALADEEPLHMALLSSSESRARIARAYPTSPTPTPRSTS